MTRKVFGGFVLAFCFTVLTPTTLRSQQTASGATASGTTAADSLPSGQPGVYIQDAAGWHLLSQRTPAKMKAKHAYLSSLSYGAVAAPVVVEYSNPHASLQVHGAQPSICVYHIMSPNSPMMVRLEVKKKTRELDSGTIRALPLGGSGHQAQADASILVPTTTVQAQDAVVVLHPQEDLAAGEYAVMFGAQNMGIFDFGVATP